MKKIKYKGQGKRLDIYLKDKLKLSRSYIQKLIKSKFIKINGKIPKPSYPLESKDIIEYEIPPAKKLDISKEDIPIEIIYEDNHILAVNKPAGLVVHPAQGNYSGTLVNAVLFHCKNLSGIGGVERPGIVHRLDKFTSGLIIIAKDDLSHQFLCQQFKDHKIEKRYLALVYGTPKQKEGNISQNIARHQNDRKKFKTVPSNTKHSKTALTYYRLIKNFNTTSLLEIIPKTGRTHQIRVHLASIGHPILGDPVYSNKKSNREGQLLHAYYLSFMHPVTKKNITLTTNFPERFGLKDISIKNIIKGGA